MDKALLALIKRAGSGGGSVSNLGELAYKDDATASYTPEGNVSAPDIDVQVKTDSGYVATGTGAATAGTAAACELPVLETSVEDETLKLNWSAGSFTPNTPTKVTMPTFKSASFVTGASANASAPIFQGSAATITVS